MDIADSGLSAPERYIVTRTLLMSTCTYYWCEITRRIAHHVQLSPVDGQHIIGQQVWQDTIVLFQYRMCPQLHVPDFLMLSVVILVPAGITTELLVWRAVEHHPAFETGFSLDSFTYDTVFSHNFIFIDLRANAGIGSGGWIWEMFLSFKHESGSRRQNNAIFLCFLNESSFFLNESITERS